VRIEAGVGVGGGDVMVGGSVVFVGDETRVMHAAPRSVNVVITMRSPMIRFCPINSS
jgi:N-dimethylarginine dimethylaminohydrolase